MPPSAVWIYSPEFSHRVAADGSFAIPIEGAGFHDLFFGARGYLGTGTKLLADGKDITLEIVLVTAPPDASYAMRDSKVHYIGEPTDASRIAALEETALCDLRYGECPEHEDVRSMIDAELERSPTGILRTALLLAYLAARENLTESNPNDRTYASELLTILEPHSPLWLDNTQKLVVATRATGNDEYFMRAFREQPDPLFATLIAQHAVEAARAAGNEAEFDRRSELLADPRVQLDKLPKMPDFAEHADHGPQLGDELPSFSATTLDGVEVGNDRLPARLTLVHFWGTWCGACKPDMPLLHELTKRYDNQDFAILSVAQDESVEKVERFTRGEWPMPWHHVVVVPDGPNQAILDAFEMHTFPTWYLVDQTGRVVLSSRGPMDGAEERRKRLKEEVARRLDE